MSDSLPLEVIDPLAPSVPEIAPPTRVLRVRFKIANRDSLVERKIADFDAPHLHSHVELQFSDGSSFSSRAFASGEAHKQNGTAFENIEFSPEHWNTIDVPVAEEDEARVHAFCVDNDGEGYDFAGVAEFECWLFHEDPNKWFCSEVVATAIQQTGYLRDLVPHKTSPDRLYSALKELFP